ncbi:MGH1-like glycoside hydrolase domain-containing protein [Flavobacterium crassostreae]|uniref:Trehalase n=1 Tax=Flavobacterium crassostreae TaxID=1763534 RepID=A0A1B9DYN1_9FLAO|nr:trehalase family glycosidase [Flavobacterium crassostreae]OCB74801.1 trehalase [Flavobacterium crassostreae]
MHPKKYFYILVALVITQANFAQEKYKILELSKNNLNYTGNPTEASYKEALAFSDKGAWFAYGLLAPSEVQAGFAGPFLMTQQNGVWLSTSFVSMHLINEQQQEVMDWKKSLVTQTSYNSHLEQKFQDNTLRVEQQLVFLSGHTAIQKTSITNISSKPIVFTPTYYSKIHLTDLQLSVEQNALKIVSTKSNAVGYLQFIKEQSSNIQVTNKGFKATTNKVVLKPNETKEMVISQTFIFPQYNWKTEQEEITNANFATVLDQTKQVKENQLAHLKAQMKPIYQTDPYTIFMSKLVLTLQNNTRIAAEGLQHDGLFPSYHYQGFHGFWAWDSWKHAAAIAHYDAQLAKNQIRALFDFQEPNGFIPDCIFRDTSIETNNYRNTKAPLAAWAVWEIYQQTKDLAFITEMYPKLQKYHAWWYNERDNDQDGICEFGATDGSLIAGKWESGMDNAVRFDHSKMLKNNEKAYSIDQESVDLNAFLYAEKNYLNQMATVLKLSQDQKKWKQESSTLKKQLQIQFWDPKTGWFYDTTLDGTSFIKQMGCEGYLPLWAGVATSKQARAIKNNLMDPNTFNTLVPLPTLAANNPKFKPDNGYWRGPIWLDQSYFGIHGLEKQGFKKESQQLTYKLIHNAEGALNKGMSIRENYHPLSGKGLEAESFSWSAAHYLLLLLNN